MNRAFWFGPFVLFPATRMLRRDGLAVPIGSRAFDVLVGLVEQCGKVISHRDLMARAWPGLVVEDSNLRVQIQALRRALRRGNEAERYIVSVAGRGYCFVSDVKGIELSASQDVRTNGQAGPSQGSTKAQPPPVQHSESRPTEFAMDSSERLVVSGREHEAISSDLRLWIAHQIIAMQLFSVEESIRIAKRFIEDGEQRNPEDRWLH